MTNIEASTLFSSALVDCANQLQSTIEEIARVLPQEDKSIASVTTAYLSETMSEVRTVLSRSRYRVGFLGGSQAGKSRLLNCFLGQPVVPVGAGATCTSCRISIRSLPDSAPPEVFLHYMTDEAWRERVADVAADLLQLCKRTDSLEDHEILRLLEAPANAKRVADDPIPVAFLKRLLKAKKDYRSLINHPPVERPVATVTQVATLLNDVARHDGRQDVSSALLNEISIGLPGLALPRNLELVDLPGLSTKRPDAAYTLRSARNLDGAIIALNTSTNLEQADTYRIVATLNAQFEALADRIWIALTRVDGVSAQVLAGRPGANLIDTIIKVIQSDGDLKGKVHLDRILFTSSEWYLEKVPVVDELVRKGFQRGDDGGIKLPDAYNSHPKLGRAFQEFSKDGGIAALQDLVNSKMENAVREQVNRELANKLRKAVDRALTVVDDARSSVTLGVDGRATVRRWREAVQSLCIDVEDDLTGRPSSERGHRRAAEWEDPLRPAAKELRRSMQECISNSLSRVRPGFPLMQCFQDLVEDLHVYAIKFMAEHGPAQQYLSELMVQFDVEVQGLERRPEIDERVRRFRQDFARLFTGPHRSRLEWDLRSVADPILVDQRGASDMPLDAFREVMLRKVDEVVRRLALRIRNLAFCSLSQLHTELLRLTPAEDKVTSIETTSFDQILQRLEGMKQTLSQEASYRESPPPPGDKLQSATAVQIIDGAALTPTFPFELNNDVEQESEGTGGPSQSQTGSVAAEDRDNLW